jgi:hypothetical protein
VISVVVLMTADIVEVIQVYIPASAITAKLKHFKSFRTKIYAHNIQELITHLTEKMAFLHYKD